ncbi:MULTISPECIES: maleylacetate reductase [unclassified Sphingomonas]|uniref:maleylacetate reductase n=1 Tax=unclassified Sphingomonas TaxID=196159 RepID=UPI0006FF3418|nr:MULTISPECIES: maleylacetate reductase [unclassified Sphingomonas]KQX22631.1 Maleylacetate reductase [Sphingomonas sp. Root1294]KQY67890.1 Maleylacetate reductase [Sphingomonas sp. Root50]KRB88814.1 Maleylacetate reductase [Sphingomonas sp. Root720]
MQSFIYKGIPTRVVFGSGTSAGVGDEMDRLSVERALLLSTPQQRGDVERLASRLGGRAIAIYDKATMHTPVSITDEAMQYVEGAGIDVVVALGGGSTIGLAKAIALRTDLPQIVLPTTYAGSEMTPILGQTEHGLKTTISTRKVQPEVVIYDVDLTLSLPPGLSGTSGINAIAHAVEALYAQDRNPIISLIAEEAVRALAGALPRIAAAPDDREARSDALYGAWLCGVCLGSTGVALHHKLCHVLGGSFDLPHAETHTAILPHVVAYNARAAPDAIERLSRALGSDDPAHALWVLAGRVGASRALRDLGLAETDAAQAATMALENAYWNPRSLEAAAIRQLMRRAWAGEMPAGDHNLILEKDGQDAQD